MAESGLRTAASELVPVARRLPAYLRLTRALLRERRLRPRERLLLLAGLAYAVSPVDLLPGWVPVLGQLDDLLLFLSALDRSLRRLSPARARLLREEAGLGPFDLEADRLRIRRLTGALADGALAWAGGIARRATRSCLGVVRALRSRFGAGRGRGTV